MHLGETPGSLHEKVVSKQIVSKESVVYSSHGGWQGLDDFNRIMLDLTNIGVKIEEEDQAIILLSSLPKPYEHFVNTLLYGKQTLTMSEVKAALNSKELQKKGEIREILMEKGSQQEGKI